VRSPLRPSKSPNILSENADLLTQFPSRAFYFCSFLGPSIKLARPPKSLASIVPDVLDVWSSLADDIWTLHKLGFVGRRIANPAAEWSKYVIFFPFCSTSTGPG
jgi:hypothetical protein